MFKDPELVTWVSEFHHLVTHLNLTKLVSGVAKVRETVLQVDRLPSREHALTNHYREQLKTLAMCLSNE